MQNEMREDNREICEQKQTEVSTTNKKGAKVKRNKFNGAELLDSFLAQFEACARRNGWTEDEKTDILQCSLEKPANQILW